jgi:hypothetical protein
VSVRFDLFAVPDVLCCVLGQLRKLDKLLRKLKIPERQFICQLALTRNEIRIQISPKRKLDGADTVSSVDNTEGRCHLFSRQPF